MDQNFKARALQSIERLQVLRRRLSATEADQVTHSSPNPEGAHDQRSRDDQRVTPVEHVDRNVASLRLWLLTLDSGSVTRVLNQPETAPVASALDDALLNTLLGLLEQYISDAESETDNLLNRESLSTKLLIEKLDAVYKAVQRLNSVLQTSEETIPDVGPAVGRLPTSEDRERLVHHFKARIRANYFPQECATVLSGYPNRRAWGLADIEFLWNRIPRIPGIHPNSIDWRQNPSGILISPDKVRETDFVLGCFCDAWDSILANQSNADDISCLRNMSKIVLTLSIIKDGRQGLGPFVKRKFTNKRFPFDSNVLQFVFADGSDRLRKYFNGQQYRIAHRIWTEGHMVFYEDEPLPLQRLHGFADEYGSFGRVDKVFDVKTDQFFARKLMVNQVHGAKEQMVNEIKTLEKLSTSSMDHHIVEMKRSYERPPNELGFLLLPIADSNLASFLQQYCSADDSSKLKDRDALMRSFGCLSRALRYLHKEASHRHRDVKPGNILYHEHKTGKFESPQFVWADFGYAKDFQYAEASQTYTGDEIGTREYIAPEVGYQTRPHGTKTDIFSFGCVWLEILNAIIVGTVDRGLKESVCSLQPYRSNLDKLNSWIDDRLGETDDHVIKKLLKIAKGMVKLEADERPTIDTVVMELGRLASSIETALFCKVCYPYIQSEHSHHRHHHDTSSGAQEHRGLKKVFDRWKRH